MRRLKKFDVLSKTLKVKLKPGRSDKNFPPIFMKFWRSDLFEAINVHVSLLLVSPTYQVWEWPCPIFQSDLWTLERGRRLLCSFHPAQSEADSKFAPLLHSQNQLLLNSPISWHVSEATPAVTVFLLHLYFQFFLKTPPNCPFSVTVNNALFRSNRVTSFLRVSIAALARIIVKVFQSNNLDQ